MSALIGRLSITASDGTELEATSDLRLAWLWAETEINARPAEYVGGWEAVTYRERIAHVSAALAELRRSAAE